MWFSLIFGIQEVKQINGYLAFPFNSELAFSIHIGSSIIKYDDELECGRGKVRNNHKEQMRCARRKVKRHKTKQHQELETIPWMNLIVQYVDEYYIIPQTPETEKCKCR